MLKTSARLQRSYRLFKHQIPANIIASHLQWQT